MSKQWGGRRPGAGSPRRHLQLDPQTARDLTRLTRKLRRERNASALIEEDVVAELVRLALKKDTSTDREKTDGSIFAVCLFNHLRRSFY